MAIGFVHIPGGSGSGTQTGTGEPQHSASASVGDQYFDKVGKKLYICTAVEDNGNTTWEVVWPADGSKIVVDSGGKTLEQYINEMNSSKKYSVSGSEPSDTSLLWVDTSAGGVIKYHDGTGWKNVLSVWGEGV